MLHVGVFHQVLKGSHNLGNAGFVVGAQKGGPVGCNEGLSNIFAQLRKIFHPKVHILFLVQEDIFAVVILYDLGFDILAIHIGAGVHVCHEPDHRYVLIGIGWQGGHHIAVLIHMSIAQAKFFQFFYQQAWPG
jgi:hypothetical protein